MLRSEQITVLSLKETTLHFWYDCGMHQMFV